LTGAFFIFRPYQNITLVLKEETINDIMQWNVRSWTEALVFWEKNVDWSNVKECMEIGGREGGLSLWLAMKGCHVLCTDLENTAAQARPLHARYGITGQQISYADINATSIPFENKFDLIVFKSVIGGIGRNDDKESQAKVFREVYKALKPGGILIFAENQKASRMHAVFRKKFTPWSQYWRYLTESEMREFLAPFEKVALRTTGFAATFGRSEDQKDRLAKVDAAFFNRLVPSSWKFIIYGIARKPK
jgi:2-polyprenyl-3-methyl-5-hydroxy-6-metoxy-1,4-benzoquinol methylase